MNYKSKCFTHPGHIRQINEDSFYVDDEQCLWIVCDGMGGHDNGNFASRLVTDIFSNFEISDKFDLTIAMIEKQISLIHDVLVKKNINSTVGTTLVILHINNNKAMCFHAGDSRCYQYNNNKLDLVTKDHARLMIDKNNMEKKVLTNAISSSSELYVELTTLDINKNDVYLLCTDGLYDKVSLNKIEESLACDFDKSIEILSKEVLSTDADDNITMVQIRALDEL